MSGLISFIGAGPGAADLITVRGARRIAEADVVVWAASLVAPECVQEHARTDAELVDSSRLTHEQAVEIYRRAERDEIKVARVHSGDPSLWGAVQEQYDVCSRMNVEVEIIAGVPAFSAAAASVGRELTVPEIAQSLILTRLEGGKTPMPDGEKVREFARHGTTMALFLSAARTGQLVTELRAGGYADDVPVLIAYKVTWPDELILRTTLGELEKTVKQHKLWRHTLFVVGRALTGGGTRSRLYDPGHFHTYRRADPAARRELRARTAGRSSEVPTPRGVRSDSDVAWWAVRDWQESARNAPRTSHARSSRPRNQAQPDLFVAEQESGRSPEETVREAAAAAEPPKADTDVRGQAAEPKPDIADGMSAAAEAAPAESTPAEAASSELRAADAGDTEVALAETATAQAVTTGSTDDSPAGVAPADEAKGTSAASKTRSTAKAKAATKPKSTKSTKSAAAKPTGTKTGRASSAGRSTKRNDQDG